MRSFLDEYSSTLAFAAGVGLTVFGIWLLSPATALIVGGLAIAGFVALLESRQ